MLTIDGFVSARRWQADDGESFITLYEIDTDVDTARANLKAAFQAGQMSKPVAVETQPPAVDALLEPGQRSLRLTAPTTQRS